MKAKEVRDLNTDELRERVREEEDQLRHLNFQHAIAQLENPMILREKRRFVARLKTIIAERERTEASA